MIYFVDLEASSLMDGGFPVEVAWVGADGQDESYLIRPAPEWMDAEGRPLVWSPESGRVHGINFPTLVERGSPHHVVARRVDETLCSITSMAVCDAVEHDARWLGMLLEAGGVRRRPSVLDAYQVYAWACRPLLDLLPPGDGPGRLSAEERIRSLAREIIASAENAEHLRARIRHRALPDARGLWRTWRAVRDGVARRIALETGR